MASDAPRFRTTQEAEDYLVANPEATVSEEDVEHLVNEEFPQLVSVPTAKEANDSVCVAPSEGPLAFQIGQWVERIGDDQCWHLEPIRRIVLQDDGEHYYKTESGLMVHSDAVRCSEEGVKRQFGLRPHLWQQWAMFRLERNIRFQRHHESDFMSLTYAQDALALWNEWLLHPSNSDFRALLESKPQPMQDKLVHHMLSPFKHMDEVMCEWDLDEVEASLFHYNAFLGSGWVTSLVVLLIQYAVPFLMLVYSARLSPRFPRFTMEENSSSVDLELIFSTSWDVFCENYTPLDKIVMQYVILAVYLIRVVPVVYNTFYETVGDSPTVVSRLNSIRFLAFQQGDDNVNLKCGYRLFTLQKSAYIALINLVLLFVLFLTNSTIDVILNALALEFVANFDKEIASQDWYDGGKRYFRAGVLEIMFLNYLNLEDFDSVHQFCLAYNVEVGAYNKRITGPIKDLQQANKDALNPAYMDVKDRMWRSMGYVAKQKNMKDALWQYTEQCSTFGIVDSAVLKLAPSALRGIFNRYYEYGTWSKFDEALFLPPVPSDSVQAMSFVPGSEILNFDADSMVHPMLRFARWLMEALLFAKVIEPVKTVYRRGQYLLVPVMFVDGVFEWCTYVFIVFMFPIGLAMYTYLITNCQPLLISTAQNPIYSDQFAFGG